MATHRERKIARQIDQLLRFVGDHDVWIATQRSRVAQNDPTLFDSQSPYSATAAARNFLGNLRWIFEFAQANGTAFDNALSSLAITRAHANNTITTYRDAFRTYRDAQKNNAAQVTAALNALEAALPDVSAIMSTTAPVDWV
jgi:hypothetical protein